MRWACLVAPSAAAALASSDLESCRAFLKMESRSAASAETASPVVGRTLGLPRVAALPGESRSCLAPAVAALEVGTEVSRRAAGKEGCPLHVPSSACWPSKRRELASLRLVARH